MLPNLLATKCMKMPQGRDLDIVENGYQQQWQFPQFAGAIDGTHIPIIVSKDNPLDYWNRKQLHSIVNQAVVDHRYLFRDIYIGWPRYRSELLSVCLLSCSSHFPIISLRVTHVR